MNDTTNAPGSDAVAELLRLGSFWPKSAPPGLFRHPGNARVLDDLRECFGRPDPGSLVVVGPRGAGKTAALRIALAATERHEWRVFELGALEIVSGMIYVGQLEARVQAMREALAVGKGVIWYCPSLSSLIHAGSSRTDSRGVLDLLWPAVRSGLLCLVSDAMPEEFETLLRERPAVRGVLREIRLEAADTSQTARLLPRIAQRLRHHDAEGCNAATARIAVALTGQFMPAIAQPGAAALLLAEAMRRALRSGQAPRPLEKSDLIEAMHGITGLPALLLDDAVGLDIAGLRRFFDSRIKGQPAAVDCMVERIALMKSGLSDPERPLGVLLFAGPTGTGKTEVVKVLAEYLFGSAGRMIRIDMSECQYPGSEARIIGRPEGGGQSLASQVAGQPFSVVLLDEFEKAHPSIWDLFLQVFDDGRLTDAQGVTVDFRQTLIVLTSNVGATDHASASPGFTSRQGQYRDDTVLSAVARQFRPEFVNRIDRVVVFTPLSRATMREVLLKELERALSRRGIRDRPWATEIEASALDFLLDAGFTRDMGARPLKRAIEQHLLAPLAITMAERRFPEGDQFVFVRSDGQRIVAEFVDPDADEAASPPASSNRAHEGAVHELLRPFKGVASEARDLGAVLERLEAKVAARDLGGEKAAQLRTMNAPGFWNDECRHAVLDRLERLDRFEAGLESARSIAERLRPTRGVKHLPAAMLRSLANQLYLLDPALGDLAVNAPWTLWISIEPLADERGTAAGVAWAEQLAQMYRKWAGRRHLACRHDGDTRSLAAAGHRGVDASPVVSRIDLEISGLGIHHLLADEAGLHLLERVQAGEALQRALARVTVSPTRPAAEPNPPADAQATPVRRYRQGRAPMVRDLRRGWRTPRLAAVLEGDFDLFAATVDRGDPAA